MRFRTTRDLVGVTDTGELLMLPAGHPCDRLELLCDTATGTVRIPVGTLDQFVEVDE